jgi:hypothetical protein
MRAARSTATAKIDRSVLWKRVEVEAGAQLRRMYRRTTMCEFRPASIFSRVGHLPGTLGDLAERPEKALPGRLIGENLVVPFG